MMMHGLCLGPIKTLIANIEIVIVGPPRALTAAMEQCRDLAVIGFLQLTASAATITTPPFGDAIAPAFANTRSCNRHTVTMPVVIGL